MAYDDEFSAWRNGWFEPVALTGIHSSFVLFVWCLTAHQHKRPLAQGFGQFVNVFDEIIQLGGWVSEVYKVGSNVENIKFVQT